MGKFNDGGVNERVDVACSLVDAANDDEIPGTVEVNVSWIVE